MDLSKVPTEDLHAIAAGKWSDVSTAGLQEYQSQRQHQEQAQQQAQNPQAQTVPDAADKASNNNKPYFSPGESATNNYWTNIKARITDPERYKAIAGMDSPAAQNSIHSSGAAAMALPEAAAPEGLASLAKYLGSSAPLRVGANAALGAGEGAVNSPSDRMGGAVKGGMLGGAMGAGGEALGGLGDFLMQKAVGMKKFLPGVGTTIADQGVVGTKGMMANQVDNKLTAEEDKLQGLVKDLTGTVNSKEIGDAVSQKAKQFTLPSTGEASPFSQAELQKVRGLSDQLSKMGNLSGEDLLALKRQGDYQGFTAGGTPATSTEADLGRMGADAARRELKKMAPEAADSLMKEGALINAKRGLNKPDSINSGLGAAMLFGKVPGSSLLGSVGAQAAVKGGQTATNPLVQQAIEQGLFNNKPQQ